MEHAIGEIVPLPNGRKVEVVEGKSCEGCAVCMEGMIACIKWTERGKIGTCFSIRRTDHKNIIYKEIKDMDTSYEKYLQEKALLEAYGHTSVITYEEWKQIKEDKQ